MGRRDTVQPVGLQPSRRFFFCVPPRKRLEARGTAPVHCGGPTLRSTVMLLLPILAVLAQSPSPPATEILAKARDACRSLRSATYRARWERQGTGDPIVREAKVQIARWEPGDGGRAKRSSKLGIDLRMELTDGVIYTYDGNATRILMPDEKKLLVVPVDKMGEEFVTGNVVGELVETPLISPDSLPAACELRGTEEIGGVSCHVLTSSPPDSELVQDVHYTWHVGVADHLPRRFETKGSVGGQAYRSELVITELAIDRPLGADTFTQSAPEGYVVEQYEPKKPPELLAKGTQAPEIGLLDPEGEKHVLSDHEGEVILLDFWGTWCGPCLQALPAIQKLHEKFQDRGVTIYGVSCREPKGADPAGLMKRRGFTYTLLLAGDKVAEAYHVT